MKSKIYKLTTLIASMTFALGVITAGLGPIKAHAEFRCPPPGVAPCLDAYDYKEEGAPRFLVAYWNNPGGWDKFHFRWNREGADAHTYEGSGMKFTVRNAWQNTRYHFAIQGCESVVIGKDNCSGWMDLDYETNDFVS